MHLTQPSPRARALARGFSLCLAGCIVAAPAFADGDDPCAGQGPNMPIGQDTQLPATDDVASANGPGGQVWTPPDAMVAAAGANGGGPVVRPYETATYSADANDAAPYAAKANGASPYAATANAVSPYAAESNDAKANAADANESDAYDTSEYAAKNNAASPYQNAQPYQGRANAGTSNQASGTEANTNKAARYESKSY